MAKAAVGSVNKRIQTIKLVVFLAILPLAACNSEAQVKSVVPNTATESRAIEPVLQAGGYHNIDNTKLQAMLDKGITLVDIRLPEEWRQTGIIKGSKTITFFERSGRINPNFVPEFTALVKPDQPVALICRTGNRTKAASEAIAKQLGYKQVYNVTHGITRWIAEKRPVVKYNK